MEVEPLNMASMALSISSLLSSSTLLPLGNLASMSLSRSSLSFSNVSLSFFSSNTTAETSKTSENVPFPKCRPTVKSILRNCGILSHISRSASVISVVRYSFTRSAVTLSKSCDDGFSPKLSSNVIESMRFGDKVGLLSPTSSPSNIVIDSTITIVVESLDSVSGSLSIILRSDSSSMTSPENSRKPASIDFRLMSVRLDDDEESEPRR